MVKYISFLCILGGIASLAIAIILRLIHIHPLLMNPVLALWRVSVSLLLIAIAIGVNKK